MAIRETLDELLATGENGDIAIGAPGRPSLDYAGLRQHVTEVRGWLNQRGIASGDRIATVLPNGPEAASAFLCVATTATAAPLNPAYRDDELDFYLSDLGAKALLIDAGLESPARAVAARRGISIIELKPRGTGPAGLFDLEGEATEATTGIPNADDVALVLHTSGTTSRPKLVPLSQRNLCASAHNVRSVTALTRADRCLNIMPLFHIHGLVAALLASVSAGASVFYSPGFNALKFFGWVDEVKPTWYTAVPTMHQAILARSERNRTIIERTKLRFIRSSSSSLPAQVMRSLEDTFGAPVIEAYGMTEAAHQMASNPLPPAIRKGGSVGVGAGPEIAIMSESGDLLGRGETGEIVIRGVNVTAGYANNAKANEEAFTNGWFRTGDQGVLDADGYLSITGRLKEIINRGGEKISPREVDEVLLDHPSVAQAVTFAMPHAKLGEAVASAVVLRESTSAEERELRDFVGTRLADFKVPTRILILDEIPKGATGKVQRIGLAEKLGLVPAAG